MSGLRARREAIAARPHNDALDTNFENYVDVVGFFDPANTDTLEFVFDIQRQRHPDQLKL